MITIRIYQTEDAETLHQLFFDTIRNINIHDYSLQQVAAWAPDDHDVDAWQARMDNIQPFIAEMDGKIAGYADVQPSGLVDHFFCSQKFQGKGIGRVLMQRIFENAKEMGLSKLHSHVSKTAKPFFQHFGFEVVREQTVETRGVELNNFYMEKTL